jgi:drug/metabolite transporter (DMT)-like permease
MLTEKSKLALALFCTLVPWASAFAAIRAALEGYPPGHLALVRFVIASGVLLTYGIITRMGVPDLRDIPRLLFLGIMGITLYHVPLNYGEVTVSAGAASLLIATVPVFTALFALLILREGLPPLGWIGMAISFAGATLIAFGEGNALSFNTDALLILLAGVCESVYFVLQKDLLAKYGAVRFATYAVVGGTLGMLPFAPGVFTTLARAPLHATLSVIYLGVVPAAFSIVAWSYAIAHMKVSKVASMLYLSPVIAMGIAWVWLGEIPSLLTLGGGTVAILGVLLVYRSKNPEKTLS